MTESPKQNSTPSLERGRNGSEQPGEYKVNAYNFGLGQEARMGEAKSLNRALAQEIAVLSNEKNGNEEGTEVRNTILSTRELKNLLTERLNVQSPGVILETIINEDTTQLHEAVENEEFINRLDREGWHPDKLKGLPRLINKGREYIQPVIDRLRQTEAKMEHNTDPSHVFREISNREVTDIERLNQLEEKAHEEVQKDHLSKEQYAVNKHFIDLYRELRRLIQAKA